MTTMLTTRGDLLKFILNHLHESSTDLFQMILKNNNLSRQGFLVETLVELLIISKCFPDIVYSEILDGQIEYLHKITDISKILKNNIHIGDNPADVIIKQDDCFLLFSIKYKGWKKNKTNKDGFKPSDTDIVNMKDRIQKLNVPYKLGLFVKNKKLVTNHTYKQSHNSHKIEHEKLIKNNMLFDTDDIIIALQTFCNRFSQIKTDKDFINLINIHYLDSPRRQLVLKLHQKLTIMKFIRNLKYSEHLISQKMRSGKSIEFLWICKYMMEKHNYNKILIMTSVPSTIDDFTNTLDTFIDFQDIEYTHWKQTNFPSMDFNGIMFCSVQYLKVGNTIEKQKWLKNLSVDMIIIDESHDGSSNQNTRELLDVAQNIKKRIFVSGTSTKTEVVYKIPNTCIYKWDLIDEAWMKKLQFDFQESFLEDMIKRHGDLFRTCFFDETLDKDYSKCPTQVLMKHVFPQTLITNIHTYETKYGTDYGYSCSGLFALKRRNGKFVEEFEICTHSEGKELLIHFLQTIISEPNVKNTLMKQIEDLQSKHESRQTDNKHPLLFLIYLPTHTRNNNILQLQRTLVKFLKDNELWTDFQIESSNSQENSGSGSQNYNDFILEIMKRTKDENKKGCILFLGEQGGTGITYHDCDVTISLDDGHSLDNQLQKYARAMTGAKGKTIGINVDMNIQRTYSVLLNTLQQYRKMTNTTKSNAEILYYLYEQSIFFFDPHELGEKFLDMKIFENISQEIMNQIDDQYLLNCINTYDSLRSFITHSITHSQSLSSIPKYYEGEQQDCPKGEKLTMKYKDNMNEEDNMTENDSEIVINKTFELCKSFLFPLLALLSRSYNIDFKDIFKNPLTKNLMYHILIDKKIHINEKTFPYLINIMNDILDNNEEIVNNIREIYRIASPENLRTLIEKHFIPSSSEQKHNAEIPTPVLLVDEMLNKMPVVFWTTLKTVFEPCCGKGNFVVGIFDKYFDGLKEYEKNKVKRCQLIIEKCLYFGDLTCLNVFITTEILKCHVQHKCGKKIDLKFNSNMGDTLTLNIKDKWGIDKFDAVIGNPPYQEQVGTKKTQSRWNKFVMNGIESLEQDGYLVFIHPSGWRNIDGKFKNIQKELFSRQLLYLEIHNEKDGLTIFKKATRYDWYVLKNTENKFKTRIRFQDGVEKEINVSKLEFIPNGEYDRIMKLIDKNESVNVLYSRSAYGTDKKHMSRTKTTTNKYPCVYTVNSKDTPTFYYSTKNTEGHFGIPKLIWSNGAKPGSYIDKQGEYGLTSYSYAIVDDVKNLENIKKAFDTKSCRSLLELTTFGQGHINYKILSVFKKDFWKEFI